jgi:hypothetical protein
VSLRDATTLLRHNAVRQGCLVFECDVTERRSFELPVEREYDDEAATLDREADVTFDRILSRAK